MKTWNKTISLLCNDEQQIVANEYPDLRVNGVPGCSVRIYYFFRIPIVLFAILVFPISSLNVLPIR